MKTVFNATVENKYQSQVPHGYYDPKRGHTGVDLEFVNENLISPITGTVLLNVRQNQMGNCMYVEDSEGAVHVFAHLHMFHVNKGEKITRGQLIAITGNTGNPPLGGIYPAHLHYEIVTQQPFNAAVDSHMFRTELPWKGYNTDPIAYLKHLYAQFGIDTGTMEPIGQNVPGNHPGF